jgi:hypothetical protein
MAMMMVLAGIAPLAQAVDCIMHTPAVSHHHDGKTMPVAQCLDDGVVAVMPEAVAGTPAHVQDLTPLLPAVVLEWQQPALPVVRQSLWPPGDKLSVIGEDVISRTGRRRI